MKRNLLFLFATVLLSTAFTKAYAQPVPDLGPDVNVCGGTATLMEMSGIDPLTHSFEWFFRDFGDPVSANVSRGTSMIGSITVIDMGGETGIWTLVVTENAPPNLSGSDEIELRFFPMPMATAPANNERCDWTAGDPVAEQNDGQATFNLLANNADILNGQDPAIFEVSYHNNMADAMADVGAIPMPSMYMSAGGETIWARVDPRAFPSPNATCQAVVSFDLIVNPNPIAITPPDQEICDDDNDGFAEFDLGDLDLIISGGDPTQIVNYYLTASDAENAPGTELPKMNYTNVDMDMQNIWARVEDTPGTGCFNVVTFRLLVLESPEPNLMPNPYPLCDTDGDDIETFDLISRETEILGGLNPADFIITWYASMALANDPTEPASDILDPVNFAATGTPPLPSSVTVYARVINQTQSLTTRCFTVVPLELVINPVPTPTQPPLYELCDDDTGLGPVDGLAIFDLRSRDDIITVDVTSGVINTSWAVTYYDTMAEAQIGDPMTELPDMFQNTVVGVPQTIWARVQDISTGCFSLISQTLVVNPNPSPTPVGPLESCDQENDGTAMFDLDAEALIIMNGENVTISFHETQANAISNTSPLGSLMMYDGTMGSIWARSTDADAATSTECFTVLEIMLIVNPTPIVDDPLPTLYACDDDGDNDALFDLTDNAAAIYGMQAVADFTLTYHETQVSADDIVDAGIADPVNYESDSRTIFVRLLNPLTDCFTTGMFEIERIDLPVFMAPLELIECDTDLSGSDADGITTFDLTEIETAILATNPDLTVQFFANAGDIPGTPIPTPAAYVAGNGATPVTIFVQVQSTLNGMCTDQTTVDLIVNPLPLLISDPLPNAVACDEDNDGFAIFDLDAYGIEIINGQPDVTVTFYETLADASGDTPTNEIMNTAAYNNISGSTMVTTLFARAENMNANGVDCYKVYPFALEAHRIPVLPADDLDITVCDTDGSGDESIDLVAENTQTIQDAQFGTSSFTYTVTYHATMAGAEDITDPGLPDPMNYVQAANTTVTLYYRVIFDDGSDCFIVGEFDVTVSGLPVIFPIVDPIIACDDDPDDGVEVGTFDLDALKPIITGGDDLLDVTFYANAAELAAGNAIPDDQLETYQNITNTQLVEIVVTNLAGCEISTNVLLRVLPLPTPDETAPEPIIVCDDDGTADGLYLFDLTSKLDEIDPSPVVVRRVFESQADADAYDVVTNTPVPVAGDVAPLTLMYTNTTPNRQELFVRIDHLASAVPGNTCYSVVSFEVIVNPIPIFDPAVFAQPYVFCEQPDGDDTVGDLILDDITNELVFLLAPQPLGDFTITYHETIAQAQTNSFILPSMYTFNETTNPNAPTPGLWVRVENNVTFCFDIEFLEIQIDSRPASITPGDLMACEDIVPDEANGIPTPGFGTFDLTVQNEVINGGPLDANTEILYFISNADALNVANAIPTPDAFQNTVVDGQTIWAVVRNITTTCPSSPPVFFEISVKPTPYTDLSEEGGDICVDPVTGIIQEPVTLDATPETIVPTAVYTYEWRTDDPVTGTLVSIDPMYEVTDTGIYYVTVTATYEDLLTGMITTCDYVAVVEYTPISSPIFEVEVLEDSFNAGGLYTVEVIASTVTGFGSADYEYAIDDGPFQTSLVFNNIPPGDHIVYGRRIDGNCEPTPVEIGIIDYPRFFTPNADGFHDTWNILGIGVEPNLNAKIYIFDRYGKLLKQLSPSSPGWNGTFNGQPMPSSDYWFRVEYTEPGGENVGARKEFAGHFTLKR